MTAHIAWKFALAATVMAAASGCATVPGDPYYDGGYSSGPVYDNSPIYGGAYPVYPGPVGVIGYSNNDRWEDMRNDRDRRAWRERQAERERDKARWERDQRERARDRDKDRDRANARERDRERAERARNDAERQRNDVARQQREREVARRQQAERARGQQEGRNQDGTPRTDYDRYNPSNGRWMKRSEDMP